MILSLIVAVSKNGVIGNKGKIPWFVRGEQKRFKEITMGHPIIMGRLTHESIGKTLPGRDNIVISSDKNYKLSEGSILVHSLDEALSLPQVKAASEVFVIGGERVFTEALPLAKKLYLTIVHTEVEGDKFFKFDKMKWQQINSEFHAKDEVPDRPFDFEICTMQRKS